MKQIKKPLPLILAMIMLVSILTIPASAASDTWQTRFRQFPTLSSGSGLTAYVKALQTFLYVFSDETKKDISDGGGIDGSYGSKTMAAVKKFQEYLYPNEPSQHDCITGPNTWGGIARVTEVFQPSQTEYRFIWYAENSIRAISTSSGFYYSYCDIGTDNWHTFRTP